MKKVIKITALVISTLVLLLIISWIGLAIFITYNKEYLRNKLVNLIEDRTNAQVQINEVSASFFKTFPFISLEISGITIRDSLYIQHHHDLFQAKQVLLRASPISLITDKRIGKIIIRSGSAYLFTDSTGYSNKYILRQKQPQTGTRKVSIPGIRVESFLVEVINQTRNKHYKGYVRKLDCDINAGENGNQEIKLVTDLQVAGIGFNTNNGYYIANTKVRSKLKLYYSASNESLSFNNLVLNINNQPLAFTGTFDLSKATQDFTLDIRTGKANYAEIVKFFPVKTRKVLSGYNISSPVELKVHLKGKTAINVEPHVRAEMIAKKNEVSVPDFNLSKCSFHAIYDNRRDSTLEISDANSIITFTNIKGEYAGIPVSANKTTFKNLERPCMETDIHADFLLTSLNRELQSTTLRFNNGRAIINANFEGLIAGIDSTSSRMNGYIKFRNCGLTYLPRGITAKNLEGDLLFKEKDLLINGFTMNTGKSNLSMEGKAENFLSLFNISPEKLLISWKVSSKELFLEDFMSYLSKRSGEKKKNGTTKTVLSKASNKIDRIFTDGMIHIVLSAPALHYRKFDAENVHAAIQLGNDYANLENASLNHGGGTASLKGRLLQTGVLNKIILASELHQINVPLLFKSFSEFGQDAITSKNLKGKLTASINLETFITDAAKTNPELTRGTIKFLLEDGELNDFEPVKKISEKAFKKQDFSNIRFANLENKLEIKGTSYIVNRMEIRSTAVTMFIEGVYDTKKGTDMSIVLPVRNLTKSNADTDLTVDGKGKKGLSVRLRAHTGKDGKLEVDWDPFKKAVKNKEAKANAW